MEFLDAYWDRGCLLSRDRSFFEYEYVVDGRPNVFIAENAETHSIDAMIGFIQASRRRRVDGFTSMWVARPRSGTPFLGMLLLENIRKLHSIRRMAATGLRADTSVLLRNEFSSSANKARRMEHFYRLADRDVYRIARVENRRRPAAGSTGTRLIPLPTMERVRAVFDFEALPDTGIRKDEWYFERRYFVHPYFRFNVWGVEKTAGKCEALLVGRVVQANGGRALRIMDFFGGEHALEGIGSELDFIMRDNDLEYTDFYCLGISPELMQESAGFMQRDESDPNVIPNHFEPFERKNVDIWVCGYGINDMTAGLRLFKGDGDQGHPKRLRLPEEWERKDANAE